MQRAGLALAIAAVACAAGLQAQAPPQKPGLTPRPASPSDLRVRVERIGVMPTHGNPTSPAVAGSWLLLIDQSGYLYRWDGTAATLLLSSKTLPKDVRPLANEWLLNAAADRAGTKVYVVFVSASVPKGVPKRESPRDRWGRHPGDDASREGSFLIGRLGNSRANAPVDEPGFVQPVAEFGRVVHEPIAVSGPVSSPLSFARITLLFGDLVGGRLMATTGPLGTRRQEVFEVGVVDAAGVLFERTGEFHRVTEIR